MNRDQLLRWKILNGKLKIHKNNPLVLLDFITDMQLAEYEISQYEISQLDAEVPDEYISWNLENLLKHKKKTLYSRIIENGEIQEYNTNFSVFGIPGIIEINDDPNNIPPEYYFCFIPNEEKIKEIYNQVIDLWKQDSGINKMSYFKQRKIIAEQIQRQKQNLGEKKFYELKLKKDTDLHDYLECCFAMEKDNLIHIEEINSSSIIINEITEKKESTIKMAENKITSNNLSFDAEKSCFILNDEVVDIPRKDGNNDSLQYLISDYIYNKSTNSRNSWDQIYQEIMGEPSTEKEKISKQKKRLSDAVRNINQKTTLKFNIKAINGASDNFSKVTHSI